MTYPDFGKSKGDDPCVPTGMPGAMAWASAGRCAGRTGRSPIVSAQSGSISKSRVLTQGSASLAIGGEPTYGPDGTIYVNQGYLSALDPVTLATKWSLGVDYTWPVVIGKDGTLFQAGGGTNTDLRALDPANGAEKWTRDLLTYLRPPVVLPDGNLAMVLSGTGKLDVKLIDATTGADIDTIPVPDSGIHQPSSIAGSSDGTIYFYGATGKLFAISTTTRSVKWESTMNALSVAYDEKAEKLFVLAAGGTNSSLKVGVVDTATGVATFNPPISGYSPSQIALGEDGWVYFTIQGGTLVGYHTKTSTKWEATTGAFQTVPSVGGDGTIYVGAHKSNGTYAQAFTKTGTLKWDKLMSTSLKNTTRVGASTSIAPSGHLHVLFAVNDNLFQLGP